MLLYLYVSVIRANHPLTRILSARCLKRGYVEYPLCTESIHILNCFWSVEGCHVEQTSVVFAELMNFNRVDSKMKTFSFHRPFLNETKIGSILLNYSILLPAIPTFHRPSPLPARLPNLHQQPTCRSCPLTLVWFIRVNLPNFVVVTWDFCSRIHQLNSFGDNLAVNIWFKHNPLDFVDLTEERCGQHSDVTLDKVTFTTGRGYALADNAENGKLHSKNCCFNP